MGLKWYVARTKPLAEYATRDSLQAAGVEAFLPCTPMRPNRWGHPDAPMFPGYLFLKYDFEMRGWDRLHRIPQPVRLVAFGGVPPPVSNEIIDELVQRVEAYNGRGGLWTRFRPGQRVRVTSGPVESLAQVVEESKSPRDRVKVLMEFLGRIVEAKVPWHDVWPVGTQDSPTADWNKRPARRTRGNGRWISGHGPRLVQAHRA